MRLRLWWFWYATEQQAHTRQIVQGRRESWNKIGVTFR